MRILIAKRSTQANWRKRLLFAVFAALSSAHTQTGFGQSATGATTDPAAQRPVHAVAIPSTNVDTQTSWIIEPEVPRIPKIPGLEPNLPPHIERRLSYAFDLAQRGATYSANAEFQAVISLCALELDSRTGGTSHRDALHQAWVAIDEADQFGEGQLGWREAADVRNAAANHTTPVLRNATAPVGSMQAVEAYYKYAEERLTYSCKDMHGTSLAFYGLGRTYMMSGTRITHGAAKAALVERVALLIAPQNVLAGNELGVLLAQHGHLEDAEMLFRQCLAVSQRQETWRNLAAVYARQGNVAASQSATAEADALAVAERKTARLASNNAVQSDTAATNEEPHDKKAGFLARFSVPSIRNPFRR